MVGSSGRATNRSKEAVGMMALHESLRTVCLDSDWTYSVFWTIRPRPRVRGGNGCKVGDDNGSLMLMWEDGFFRGRVSDCLDEIDREDPVRRAFSKMSIQLYNYGEGLMGKVASDKCHKWVFKEPTESEPNVSNYWQSSFDSIPSEWIDQFDSGIQTIAVIQAGHGLLQLGSSKIIHEDLHFVLRMRHTFESLAYQSGPFLSRLFSSNQIPDRAAPDFFDRPAQQPLHPATSTPQYPASRAIELPRLINERLVSVEEMMGEERRENDIKWPSILSMFQETDHSLGQLGSKYNQNDLQMMLESDNSAPMNRSGGGNLNEILQLDKSGRSYALPSKMALTSPPSSSRAPNSRNGY